MMNKVLYICNRHKCDKCHSGCFYTEDINYAANFDEYAYDNYRERFCILDRAIHEKLLSYGISTHLLGYDCLKTAVSICLRDRRYLRGVTTLLYPAITELLGLGNWKSVERGIRHAIEYADNTHGLTHWPYGSNKSNSVFISHIVEELLLESRGL